jgi:hypothetical protein
VLEWLCVILQNSNAITLTNVDNTIRGNGVIGKAGVTLVKGTGGTLPANIWDQRLTLSAGASG